jgi:hypothetical protein
MQVRSEKTARNRLSRRMQSSRHYALSMLRFFCTFIGSRQLWLSSASFLVTDTRDDGLHLWLVVPLAMSDFDDACNDPCLRPREPNLCPEHKKITCYAFIGFRLLSLVL